MNPALLLRPILDTVDLKTGLPSVARRKIHSKTLMTCALVTKRS